MDLDSVEKLLFTEKTPVFFREFVCGKDYCNDPDIYQFWIDAGEEIPDDCSELVLDGSLGGGKSSFANWYVAYRVYRLFLHDNPREFLGISKNTQVFILYFSVSLKMAKKSGFQNLYNIFKSCSWFKKNFPINENIQSSIQFPNDFYIDYASAEGHQIGLTVWGFILDEANFRAGVGEGLVSEYQNVTSLYTQLLDRLISRFSLPDGTVNALAVLISSASYQSSFVEKRLKAIENTKGSHHIRSVIYKIRPERYSKEMFMVFLGTNDMEPCIIKDDSHRRAIEHQLSATGMITSLNKLFTEVPVSIKTPFQTNINLAIQNHCGVATQIKGRFMQDIKLLTAAYTKEEPSIFSQEILTLSSADDIQLMDFLIEENIRFPERPHSFFLDLSLRGDSGGFSCYRFDGLDENNLRKHTQVFTLEIIPPPTPFSTKISKFRTFMADFAQLVNVVAFASDQYQSSGLRQDVHEDLGLIDTRISIDSSDLFHIQWAQALVNKVLSKYCVAKLQTEVEEAEHDLKRRRVVKKDGSTDDLFQSDVGAFFLSDTVGAKEGTIDDLTSINLVGGRSVLSLKRRLGYN